MAKRAPKRAKRTYDPEGTRRRIVRVASAQFQLRGYHATSMHDIMELADVPGGSMYYYFPTKKSLGLAVIREDVAESIHETWIRPIRAAESAKDGVLSVFAAVADQIERDRRGVAGCPLNNLTLELSLTDREFQSALGGVFELWTGAVADRIRQDVRDRKLRNINPAEAATAIVAGFSGAMALAKAAQAAHPIRTCARQLLHVFNAP